MPLTQSRESPAQARALLGFRQGVTMSEDMGPRLLRHLIDTGHTDERGEQLDGDWGRLYAALSGVPGGKPEREAVFLAALGALGDIHHKQKRYWAVVYAQPLESEARERARLYSAADALGEPPPVSWCVEGLLSRPSLNLLVGPGGGKKTYTALDLAVCVAQGADWLGRKTVPTPVLIVDEESGLNRLWGRLHGVLRAHEAGPELPLHFLSLTGFDLRKRDDLRLLKRRARECDAGLIVIDALVDVMRGADENSVQDVGPLMHNLRQLAEGCQAALLVLHHTNKMGAMRGSTSISAAVDLMLMLRSEDERVEFESLKARDVDALRFSATANFADGQFWLSV